MKKMLLTIIFVLILLFSIILIYHSVTDEPVDNDQSADKEDTVLADVSSEIDDVLLDEQNEIEIGEMI